MMRTRCPHCRSVFRVRSDQTQAKAGKVRCGHCHQVFDALENLLEEASAAGSAKGAPVIDASPSVGVAHADEQAAAGFGAPENPRRSESLLESARDAGLVAARELSQTPAFNRWAAGTMATDGSIGLELPSRPRRDGRWGAALVLLCLLLAAQVIYHFRADLVIAQPRLAPMFAALAIDVPRPAHGDLIVVESSALQPNINGVGLLLGVTLKNRAPYAQAWPMLELTLMDANDQMLVRRVFEPAEYLSPEQLENGFAANGEVAAELLLDAGEMPAAGYSLYAFYP